MTTTPHRPPTIGRRPPARTARLTVFAAACSLLGAGCASTRGVQPRELNYDLQSRLDQSESKIDTLAKQVELEKERTAEADRLADGRKEVENVLERRLENLREENDRLHASMAGLVMNAAGAKPAAGGITNVSGRAPASEYGLPPSLVTRLNDFAKRHPGVAFDEDLRVCRFESRSVFLGGGDKLQDEAMKTLKELSGLLNVPEAAALNLSVVGHTDPSVSVPSELVNLHPTEWHLAAHQAIAIGQFLEENGVASTRLGILSYGGQQPVDGGRPVGNPAGAKPVHARVEVFLLPADPPAD
ncbi:MAG: OmpA family protein [Planctomycetia bacterium]